MRYEFRFGNGTVAFDWEMGVVEVRAKMGRKKEEKEWAPVEGEYPFEELPLFTSFFVTGMSALLGVDVEVRGKMVITSEGFVLEIYKTKDEKRPAFLLAYDTKKDASSVFMFNRPTLYAFLQMIKSRDKVVPVRESVWEKEGGVVYVNRMEIPFAGAKALEWVLLEGLKDGGKYPALSFRWDEGRLRLYGNRVSLLKARGESEVPYLSVSVKDPLDAMRILSCL